MAHKTFWMDDRCERMKSGYDPAVLTCARGNDLGRVRRRAGGEREIATLRYSGCVT